MFYLVPQPTRAGDLCLLRYRRGDPVADQPDKIVHGVVDGVNLLLERQNLLVHHISHRVLIQLAPILLQLVSDFSRGLGEVGQQHDNILGIAQFVVDFLLDCPCRLVLVDPLDLAGRDQRRRFLLLLRL